MTENGEPSKQRIAELRARDQAYGRVRKWQDRGLIIFAADRARRGRPDPTFEMELQRRLKDAVEALTSETVTARESSERLIGQLDASVASLTAETVRAARASDRTARRLVWLTVVLVLLTAALVALPFVQAATSGK